jgi:imidazolonepropionase-like amidohydrolase
VATTSSAAACARIANLTGVIEPARSADIIAVDGDPLADISLLADATRVVLVMKEGRVLKDQMSGRLD